MFPSRVSSLIPSNMARVYSSELTRTDNVTDDSFAEDTEHFFQLPPIAKKFRSGNDAGSNGSPAGSKQFPNYEKQAELLQVRTENAKLQSKLNALNQELTGCKIQLSKDRESFVQEKLHIESKARTMERQLVSVNEKEKEWKSVVSNLTKEAEKDRLKALEKISALSASNDELEQKLQEITFENQANCQSLQDDLLKEKREALENKCLVEHLGKEVELRKSKNLELENSLKLIRSQLSQASRKCEEQAIAMRQWREENQVATVLRHNAQDLKLVQQENASLKEQVQRYKNLSENTALIKQKKSFLEEELKRLNKILEKYINENSELTMALSKQSQALVTTEENVQILCTPRRSLSEIDALSARCVSLKDEVQEKLGLIGILRSEILQKDDEIEEMRRCLNLSLVGALERKIEKTEAASQVDSSPELNAQVVENLKAEVKMKGEKIEFLMRKFGLELDYDPESTRIVHMERNPLDLAHKSHSEELTRLKEANKILHWRLEELEKFRKNVVHENEQTFASSSSNDPDPHKNVTLNVQMRVEDLNKDDLLLKLQTEISKLREQRDRVAKKYQEIGSHYREACTFLTGYNVKLNEEHLVTVKSIYERNSGEQRHFEIQKNADGEYQLLVNDYIQEWQKDFVEVFLKNDNSFPAFFAAVTLNLYNKDKSILSLVDSVD